MYTPSYAPAMNLVLRPLTVDDIPGVAEMIRRSESFDGVPRVVQDQEMAEELDDVRIRLKTDTRIAEVDGETVGTAYTFYLPSDEREERCYIFGAVDPDHRQRGIGRSLMRWAMDRGGQLLRSSGTDLPKYLRVQSYDFQAANNQLFARLGFDCSTASTSALQSAPLTWSFLMTHFDSSALRARVFYSAAPVGPNRR